jgi:hypothetical protein
MNLCHRLRPAGKYCQVVLVNYRKQIVCNATTAAGATPMDFSGSGFSYQGESFANDGGPLHMTVGGTPARVAPGEPFSRSSSTPAASFAV